MPTKKDDKKATATVMIDGEEYTSERIASIAGEGLNRPETLSLRDIKAVCGSALTQARNRRHRGPDIGTGS